jgi:radical SAM protein with 4Fe4S-binding SPASM domain
MIILTGGEPMERDDIYKLIEYGRGRGLPMALATCGYLIDDDSIAKLKRAGVLALSFSLDGATAESHDSFRQATGAFDSVVRAAQLARRTGIRFQINTTISKVNIEEAFAVAQLAKRLGAYCFNPFILVPTGRGEELSDAILDPVEYEALLNDLLQMKRKAEIEVRVTCGPQFGRVCSQEKLEELSAGVSGCIGGREFGFISYRGDVHTCGFLDVSAGNLVENDFNFRKIWLESEFLEEIRNLAGYKDKCGGCGYVGVCGGCRARAFAITGDYLAADPVCSYQPRAKR